LRIFRQKASREVTIRKEACRLSRGFKQETFRRETFIVDTFRREVFQTKRFVDKQTFRQETIRQEAFRQETFKYAAQFRNYRINTNVGRPCLKHFARIFCFQSFQTI
jgi:hypothetical protein